MIEGSLLTINKYNEFWIIIFSNDRYRAVSNSTMGRKRAKKGKAARNALANQTAELTEEAYTKSPHSFVFQRGRVGKTVKELVMDVRKVMEPFTATSLKVRRNNVMKDFLTIAGPLHVSHFIVFSKTDVGVYMKLICIPRGPTLTFKVNEFTLAKDVLSFQRHPDIESKVFINHAVMVTNLPSDSMENKLMNITFKNLFPSINPNTVKLNNMRRSVLVNYDPETKCIDVRHYTMRVVPTGVSRTVKKLMRSKLPDLGHHGDIADLFLGQGLSDSEGEQDGPHSQVTVPQKVKDRGVARNTVSAIRLKEIGPRLTLQLIKIEEGFEDGNILYHSLVQKTAEEIEAVRELRRKKQKSKQAQKQRQEENIRKKKEEKEKHIQKTLEGMKKKKQEIDDGDDDTPEDTTTNLNEHSDDDDIEYYRQEVGQEPEPEMFTRKIKRAEGNTTEHKPKRKWAGGNAAENKLNRKRTGGHAAEHTSKRKWAGGSSPENKLNRKRAGGHAAEHASKRKWSGGNSAENKLNRKRAGGNSAENKLNRKRTGGNSAANKLKRKRTGGHAEHTPKRKRQKLY